MSLARVTIVAGVFTTKNFYLDRQFWIDQRSVRLQPDKPRRRGVRILRTPA